MSLETFLRIANALNVSANELLVDVLKDYETTTNHLIARLMARCNVHERKVALAVLVALVEAFEEDRAARTVGSLYE